MGEKGRIHATNTHPLKKTKTVGSNMSIVQSPFQRHAVMEPEIPPLPPYA